jgi:hypothetical protein
VYNKGEKGAQIYSRVRGRRNIGEGLKQSESRLGVGQLSLHSSQLLQRALCDRYVLSFAIFSQVSLRLLFQTELSGANWPEVFSLDVKSCIAVYVYYFCAICFILALMSIWIDLQVLKI